MADGQEPCNPNDIVCKMEVLRHLKGLQEGLGNEAFVKDFPELVGLDEKIALKVQGQEQVVQAALEGCGRIDEEVEQSGESVAGEEFEQPAE